MNTRKDSKKFKTKKFLSFLFFSSILLLPSCDKTAEPESLPSTTTKQHTHLISVDKAVEPTCEKDGLTQGSHCSVCDEVFVEQKVIPKLNHNYLFDSIITEKVEGINRPAIFKCEHCGDQITKSFSYEDVGMPILTLNGNFTGISKDKKVKLTAKYESSDKTFDCDATLKWQGSSSLAYPKKNYNIAFFKPGTNYDKKNKVELVESWGKQNKYTLKANWVDYSQMRNIVSAKLYGEIVKSRNIDDEYNDLVNGGAIDGYPILLYENDCYQGLYTLNIPKDNWLFAMDGEEEDRIAMISTNAWNNPVQLKEHIADNWSNGYEIEYSSTDETATGNQWIVDSFNEFIDFINNNDGVDFINGISKYVNVDRVIDNMLFTCLIDARDNVSKNIIWTTYDGVKWNPNVYDMDDAFGLVYDGTFYDTSVFFNPSANVLWEKVFSNFKERVIVEYRRIRSTVMSLEHVIKAFSDFNALIPKIVRNAEIEKWPEVPSIKSNNIVQIASWYEEYSQKFDAFISELE